MKGIRIEGISPNVGKVAVVIDPKHIICVLDTYEDVLPCPEIEKTEQYYVIFNDPIASYSVITTLELSPGLKEWIDKKLGGQFEDGYSIPD